MPDITHGNLGLVPVTLWKAVRDVHAERSQQDEKWGEQSHPDLHPILAEAIRIGTDPAETACTCISIPTAEEARVMCEAAFKSGHGNWSHILLEEVCEAMEATPGDPDHLYEELTHVAAVAIAWMEDLRRRKGETHATDR